MLSTLMNAWKIPELRSKIKYTFLLLIIFRLGAVIPVPGINIESVRAIVESAGLLSMFDMFSGGAFGNMTIFALSITPYITASIIMNLLTVAIPSLEELAKEGEEGRQKISQYTRYATIVLALIQAVGITVGLFNQALMTRDAFSITVVVLTLVAGTAFLMWLGEQITEKGIGNGISLIIFAGIVSGIPGGVYRTILLTQQGEVSILNILVFIVIVAAIVAGVVAIQEGTRKIPVQYAKRVVGRKMYGGQSTHIPLKVNQSGVIPVIFAMSVLAFPQTIAMFFGSETGFGRFVSVWLSPQASPGIYVYTILTAFLIVFFTYFYTAITFNPIEVATNMKKYGGFIPGIRPGKPTSEYLTKVLNRITLAGAIFLAAITIFPMILMPYLNIPVHFGGTAILIVVGVALETMKQIESQMLMRHYQGFLK
ncbi:preprotein translocase subunit SecY [Serpentinicella alkaliphila]|uniref:Protein translocase subunit SecY n=1 Tax=Serpentinicella alkaliphila TaxID=1734049 RepID=A0A4R2TDS1_9FIRM|nr:preprotein translocase subunit SecY [Serpentinicella alkaliphila]QUH25458.1 preprotein translocase subunit SecY [Serpentinicella alkaliphila]TCQ01620.1 protein translocase subunit secY/sec61 alpha [Serpentinicella alkaliphila]